MQHFGRRRGDLGLVAQPGQQGSEGLGPFAVSPRGKADQHLVRQDQHVAAIGMTCGQVQHLIEQCVQGGAQVLSLCLAAGRAGFQQDCAFRKDQRRVFHEDRVRKFLQRVQHGQRQSGIGQGALIPGVLGQDVLQHRIGSAASAQSLDDACPRTAQDRAVEFIDRWHGVSPAGSSSDAGSYPPGTALHKGAQTQSPIRSVVTVCTTCIVLPCGPDRAASTLTVEPVPE